MPVNLKDGAVPKPAKVYPLGRMDRDVIDATFDRLQEQSKMHFATQPACFSYPIFVVWRDLPNGLGRKGDADFQTSEASMILQRTTPIPHRCRQILLQQLRDVPISPRLTQWDGFTTSTSGALIEAGLPSSVTAVKRNQAWFP